MNELEKYLTLMDFITPKVVDALKWSGVDEPTDEEVFNIANAWIDDAEAMGWI